MDEGKLIDLEMKISYQEAAIEELQKALFDQYNMIMKLEKNLKLVTDRLENALKGDNEIGPANEKPPHY